MPRFGLDGPLDGDYVPGSDVDHTESSKIGRDLWETDILYGGFC